MPTATFAAGCFWGMEGIFCQLVGVISIRVYADETLENPSDQTVYTDTTDHAEVVQIEYDTDQVSDETLLTVFWTNQNPTFISTPYRSVIFFHTREPETIAQLSTDKFAKFDQYHTSIMTKMTPATWFHPARECRQPYLEKNGLPHCSI
ncbi:MAG: peptide-methionine (S)-S-oxide reductase MsrA [Thioploca sp.]|nr:peptide-methionine (S)-S-oxide reductase MsrA [Thioploca sp.]